MEAVGVAHLVEVLVDSKAVVHTPHKEEGVPVLVQDSKLGVVVGGIHFGVDMRKADRA